MDSHLMPRFEPVQNVLYDLYDSVNGCQRKSHQVFLSCMLEQKIKRVKKVFMGKPEEMSGKDRYSANQWL